jgi:predicted deacylase
MAANPHPTVDVVAAPEPGPVVGILGGVHGDEYDGVLAAHELRSWLPTELVRGEVRIAAPAHPAAWWSRTRTSPVDGLDLARVFPGGQNGRPTEQVAHALTERVIRGSDLLVDLHAGGAGFDMPFLCGYHGGDDERGTRSRRFAEAFAARFTWEHEGLPAPGRSLSVAFDLGVPAIYVESHGGRTVRAADLRGYVEGVRRVLLALGMIADAPHASARPVRVRGDGDTDGGILAPAAGHLVLRSGAGDRVGGGEVVGEIVRPHDARAIPVCAPHDGFVMLLRRDSCVAEGETVCIVASAAGQP